MGQKKDHSQALPGRHGGTVGEGAIAAGVLGLYTGMATGGGFGQSVQEQVGTRKTQSRKKGPSRRPSASAITNPKRDTAAAMRRGAEQAAGRRRR